MPLDSSATIDATRTQNLLAVHWHKDIGALCEPPRVEARAGLQPTSPWFPRAAGRGDEVVAAWFEYQARPRARRQERQAPPVEGARRQERQAPPIEGARRPRGVRCGLAGESKVCKETDVEDLLYRIPIFDPVLPELSSLLSLEEATTSVASCRDEDDDIMENPTPSQVQRRLRRPFSLGSFGPTDDELMEFAADM
uniref:Uncharacterized protein n=1 Tax=Aegilops tauschii TaxID=37682 RepID=N1QT01_AEGTA